MKTHKLKFVHNNKDNFSNNFSLKSFEKAFPSWPLDPVMTTIFFSKLNRLLTDRLFINFTN